MTDVYQFQTENDGDVLHKDGDLVMDAGIRTAAYLSLFGGNKEDGGFDNTQFNWWANFNESDPIYQYRSELQHLLDSIPITSGNLLRLQDAAGRDLQWFIDTGLAKTITVIITVPTVDRLEIEINIDDVKLIFVETLNA